METKIFSCETNRRQFLTKYLLAGTLSCMGCKNLFAQTKEEKKIVENNNEHQFLKASDMTYEEIFNFAYRDNLIPQFLSIAEYMGREKFIEMLKETASEAFTKDNIMKNWANSYNKTFWNQVLNREIIEKTDKVYEIKVTECLWAKTFREANAADIGYAAICHTDYATAEASNEKMIRTKTLMQGDEYCNHRWISKD
ncbi:MAG: L-2-amino-thiazoline-4-carboxylic acid hydrolase [Bacteriovoracaceae bacterium]|nr:L-2-amino-thiazoline-4-carboxylic acid hydrolase [Candidatus Brocadiales bacterium]MBL6992203.1 L-2-amino-thiazoline-4-carboxylic acid hydrolase [Bacteriovoracaceae bacterium]